MGYLVTFCFAFAAMFAYISASPFVLQNILGLSPGTYSLVFGVNSLAIMISAIIATRLAGRVAYRKMLGGGVIALLLTSVALLAVVLIGVSMIPTLVLLFVFQGSAGFIYGNATASPWGKPATTSAPVRPSSEPCNSSWVPPSRRSSAWPATTMPAPWASPWPWPPPSPPRRSSC